jgi:hypothetical protein
VQLPDGNRIPCILLANKVLKATNIWIYILTYLFEYSSAI